MDVLPLRNNSSIEAEPHNFAVMSLPTLASHNCIFARVGHECVCRKCGQRIAFHECGTLVAMCRQPAATPKAGLGDYTESLLHSVGITKERYQAAKQLFGLAPTCHCDERKEWLNSVSAWWRAH